jgi:hypothetical protein
VPDMHDVMSWVVAALYFLGIFWGIHKLRTGDMTVEPLVMVLWAALLPAAVVIRFFYSR